MPDRVLARIARQRPGSPQYLERCAAETGFQVTPLEKVVTVEADL